MESNTRRYLLEGLLYYLKSTLFVRPVRRVITRFIRRILMREYYEFMPWSVFMVLNRDVGACLVDGPRYYMNAWRYEENLQACLNVC